MSDKDYVSDLVKMSKMRKAIFKKDDHIAELEKQVELMAKNTVAMNWGQCPRSPDYDPERCEKCVDKLFLETAAKCWSDYFREQAQAALKGGNQ